VGKIPRSNLTKNDLKNLPNPNGNEFKEQCSYYTELIFTNHSRTEALKLAFPDKYQKAIMDAKGNDKMVNMNVRKQINQVENSSFTKECFSVANKQWWMKFIGKKQNVLEKLYSDAISDDLEVRDRHNASKLFLTYLPEMQKEDKLTVEVKVGSSEFKDMLTEKKKQLYNAANQDIVDVEVEDAD
jgi:hypothetical protein